MILRRLTGFLNMPKSANVYGTFILALVGYWGI